MLRKVLFILIVFICSLSKGQLDTAVNKTTSISAISSQEREDLSTIPALGDVFKPKISLGTGMLSFHGDLYSKHYQAPWTGRIGYDLTISQRLFKSFQLNFNILFGKLGANEWINTRQENFQSEIRAGGLNLLYDFGNFIPDRYSIRPWISVGVNSFEFLSKTDLFDRNGNQYYYWSDGSIKNIDENSPSASLAVNLNRDYVYETDIRERNKDGFGKYQERAWAFPIGIGALMKVTDRIDFKIGAQYYFTTTDYVDGITKNSLGTRSGTKLKDNFVYTSFSIQYDLIFRSTKSGDTLPDGYFDNVNWLAIDNDDLDMDGVRDWDDRCHGTPKGVPVDSVGCPFDGDFDGVANHIDQELNSPQGFEVNMNGVALTDEYWQNWYNVYMDTGNIAKSEVIENFYTAKKDSIDNPNHLIVSKNDKLYTVELARFDGPVPNDLMTYLLSIGDVMSTVLDDNTTVLYTAGSYKDIHSAIKRRDAFIAEGNKNAKIGYFQNGKLIGLSEDEINQLIGKDTTSNSSQVALENKNVNDEFTIGEIVYRVQLGSYKNRISKEIFKNAGSVVELEGDDFYYRYATRGYKTIEDAARAKADLVLEGYGDAFITAYKNGKRIPLRDTKATMETNVKEDITKIESFSSVDKSLVSFKVQLGSLRKEGSNDLEEKIKDLKNVSKQSTGLGMIRYTTGVFNDYSKADKYRQELSDKGFIEAFVIAVFKEEVISIQEALELLK